MVSVGVDLACRLSSPAMTIQAEDREALQRQPEGTQAPPTPEAAPSVKPVLGRGCGVLSTCCTMEALLVCKGS